MCKSAKEQFAELGVDVFEVGVNQARGWFGWRGTKFTGRNIYNMRAMCDTMRKGSYLVVTGFCCFGYMSPSVSIDGDGSVRTALFVARKELDFNDFAVSDEYYRFSMMPSDRPRYQHEVEIWHLVDDDELWQDWECRSAQYVALNGDLGDVRTYSSLDDVVTDIETALGDFAGDYDIRAIADDISYWHDGKLVADIEGPDFWRIAVLHDLLSS